MLTLKETMYSTGAELSYPPSVYRKRKRKHGEHNTNTTSSLKLILWVVQYICTIQERLYQIIGTNRTFYKRKKISVNWMMLIYFIESNMIIISVMGPCFEEKGWKFNLMIKFWCFLKEVYDGWIDFTVRRLWGR